MYMSQVLYNVWFYIRKETQEQSDATKHFTDLHYDRSKESLPTDSVPRFVSSSSKTCLLVCLSVCLSQTYMTCSDRDAPKLKHLEFVNTKKVCGGDFGQP